MVNPYINPHYKCGQFCPGEGREHTDRAAGWVIAPDRVPVRGGTRSARLAPRRSAPMRIDIIYDAAIFKCFDFFGYPQDYFIFFLEKRSKKNAHISYLLGFTDGTHRPKVSSQIYEREFATLIFCLRHRCTKNQVLQVFGRN